MEQVLSARNLHERWTDARSVIKFDWPNGPESDLCAVEELIAEWHKSAQNGDLFRFAFTVPRKKQPAKSRMFEKPPKFLDAVAIVHIRAAALREDNRLTTHLATHFGSALTRRPKPAKASTRKIKS